MQGLRPALHAEPILAIPGLTPYAAPTPGSGLPILASLESTPCVVPAPGPLLPILVFAFHVAPSAVPGPRREVVKRIGKLVCWPNPAVDWPHLTHLAYSQINFTSLFYNLGQRG